MEEKSTKAQTFSEYVLECWASRERALGHDYAIAGWMLSPCPEIQHQVKKRMDGEDKISCNNLLAKLFLPHTLSPEETNTVLAKIEDKFWSEFHSFNERSGKVFGSELRKWMSDDIPNNKSHEWHQKYSLRETKWLGKLACRVTSKITGIGNAERNWGKVKYLKSGQRAHLSGEKTLKMATLYGAASAERAKSDNIKATVWEDDDLDCLGLSKFGIDEQSLEALLVSQEARVVKCWMEEWEEDCINANTRDKVKEERILKKYGALKFRDGRQDFTISSKKVYVTKVGCANKRYVVHGMKETYDPLDVCDGDFENFHINTDLHGLLYEYYYHNPDPKVQILTPAGK